jgi:hypothetical protein
MSPQLAPPDREIARIAASQHAVIDHDQLESLGLCDQAIKYRVGVGRLHVVHRGVYSVGHRLLTVRGQWMAAVLASGVGALLSHWSAARLLGFAGGRLRPIHVLAERGHVDSRMGLRDHRTRSLHEEDRYERDGIPVTSVARTMLDLACLASWARLKQLWEEAIRIDVLDASALARLLDRTRGRRGVKPLGKLLAHHLHLPDDTRVGLETEFAAFLRERGFPLPSFNVWVGGKLVDAYWPEYGLIVELDSRAWHASWDARERDLVRDGDLMTLGMRVLRVTSRRLREQPDELEQTLRGLMGYAAVGA